MSKDTIGIQVGDQAPDFTLPTSDGKTVSLKDFLGQKTVVLYFYPEDEAPGCTVEACSFRDSYEDFKDAGAEVIGVSSDSVESHRQFAAHHKLPFILASDSDESLRKLYGVAPENAGEYGLQPGRVTYVIDKQGIVRLVFSSMMAFQQHVPEALAIIKAQNN